MSWLLRRTLHCGIVIHSLDLHGSVCRPSSAKHRHWELPDSVLLAREFPRSADMESDVQRGGSGTATHLDMLHKLFEINAYVSKIKLQFAASPTSHIHAPVSGAAATVSDEPSASVSSFLPSR